MITGIQITKAANDDLLNSFWLLDSEKGEARCLCAKGGYKEDAINSTAGVLILRPWAFARKIVSGS